MVKVFALVEFFELIIYHLGLFNVGFDGQVLLVFFANKIFEFLLHLQLGQPFLQTISLTF
jgi:ABC-type uncharacterized transport system permease subunit